MKRGVGRTDLPSENERQQDRSPEGDRVEGTRLQPPGEPGSPPTVVSLPRNRPEPRIEQTSGLVARNRELAHLDHILWKARAGSGSAVVLRGEPGVGKSALIEAAVARASDFGVVRLRGTALGERNALPKEWPQPVIELLREAPVSLTSAHESTGSELTSVQVASGVEAAARAVRAMFDEAQLPLLIAVDDCHLLPSWFSNVMSQAVSSHLGDLPVALVLAWRDTPHMASPELDVAVPEHRLEGLNLAQASTLLLQQHGELPFESVMTSLLNATAGNPSALLDAYSRLGDEQLHGWRPLPEPIPLGPALVDAFGQRLTGLAEDIRYALAAAAAGRLPVSILEATLEDLGLSVEVLRPAQKAGIVVLRGERIDFAHPLVRASAFLSVPREFRSRAHAAISRAFLARGQVERSAFHASQHTVRRDETVARLFTQSSRIALDRGDSTAAAHHEEVAGDYGPTDDASARHLARAAALWLSVGELARAKVCVQRASDFAVSERVACEIAYQRARTRLAVDLSPDVSQEMRLAAGQCEGDAPYRAVLMLVDAVSCQILGGTSDDSADVAHRAVRLARTVSSHAEALAAAALGAANVFEGSTSSRTDIDLIAVTSLLIGQTQEFPASPQLALVIGDSLVHQGHVDQALRWAQWIEDCSDTVGDRALVAVPSLIRASIALGRGDLAEAARDAGAAAELAERCQQYTLSARAFGVLAEADAGHGSYDSAFETAARLFGLSGEVGRAPRVQTLTMLANLELQRGRASSAFAWLGAANDDTVPQVGERAAQPHHDTVRAVFAPAAAEIMLLGRRRSDTVGLLDTVARAQAASAVPPGWTEWLGGISTDDITDASDLFVSAREAMAGQPLLVARVELAWGVRLAEAGQVGDAEAHLHSALAQFDRLGAQGWVTLARRELALMPSSEQFDDGPFQPSSGETPSTAPAMVLSSPTSRVEHPPWEITLLGSFSVRRFGESVSLPLSLAAQGLKIVALHEKLPVEELVELLWPDAAPGVGTRRLRNVLWRVRAASGDLLERDDNFIRLAGDAVTDVGQFRQLGEEAIRRDTPPEEAGRLAREALVLYRGELLPGDRYADWAAGYRESYARLHIQLLDLLLNEAVSHEHLQEALALLDRLIEADPYEENHYLRASDLLARSGNRRRSLATLDRAERMLTDLGLPPSRALLRARASLNFDSDAARED
jgi:DNA-binding SARP family transcriptional activator